MLCPSIHIINIRVFKNQHQSDQVEAEEEGGDVEEEEEVAAVVEEEEVHREGKDKQKLFAILGLCLCRGCC